MAMETTMQQAMAGLQEAIQQKLGDKEIRVLSLGTRECIVVLNDGLGHPQCIGVIDIIAKKYDIPVLENPYHLEIISMLQEENWRSVNSLTTNALAKGDRIYVERIADCEGCENHTLCVFLANQHEEHMIWLCGDCRIESHYIPPSLKTLAHFLRTWDC